MADDQLTRLISQSVSLKVRGADPRGEIIRSLIPMVAPTFLSKL